jgi:hypothetical protein
MAAQELPLPFLAAASLTQAAVVVLPMYPAAEAKEQAAQAAVETAEHPVRSILAAVEADQRALQIMLAQAAPASSSLSTKFLHPPLSSPSSPRRSGPHQRVR